MADQLRAVTFDLDPASLISLQEALPEWEIAEVNGATAASLTHAWNPDGVGLLVVRAGQDWAETIRLCGFLGHSCVSPTESRAGVAETLGLHRSEQNQARRADTPLLVLVPIGQEPLVRAVLEAGANSCLVLPIEPKEIASMLAHVWEGNAPERHTLDLDRAQREDQWRDEGGQG
jgi:hypothetical protein